jgi:hypothetical protein
VKYLAIFSTYVKCNLLKDDIDYLQPQPPLNKPVAVTQRSPLLAPAHILHVCSVTRMTPFLSITFALRRRSVLWRAIRLR